MRRMIVALAVALIGLALVSSPADAAKRRGGATIVVRDPDDATLEPGIKLANPLGRPAFFFAKPEYERQVGIWSQHIYTFRGATTAAVTKWSRTQIVAVGGKVTGALNSGQGATVYGTIAGQNVKVRTTFVSSTQTFTISITALK